MFYKDYFLPLFFSAVSTRMACSMLPVFAAIRSTSSFSLSSVV